MQQALLLHKCRTCQALAHIVYKRMVQAVQQLGLIPIYPLHIDLQFWVWVIWVVLEPDSLLLKVILKSKIKWGHRHCVTVTPIVLQCFGLTAGVERLD
jgi:hypothetical protein